METNKGKHCVVSVILPTYKEGKNLWEMVTRIFRSLDGEDLDGECIIVDDDSGDETESVYEQLKKEYNLRLVIRKGERGLSTAVIRGLREAHGEILVVMDADLSHPPEKIPEMIKAVRNGADFVLGSRYVDGGEIEENWGFYRKLNSRVATLLACFLTTLNDPMSGFFCIPKKTFDACKELSPVGYKIALEVLVKSDAGNVKEIPIFFSRRKHGESKMNFKEQVFYLNHLLRLYRYKYPGIVQLFLFLLVGFSGFIVDTFFYFFLQLFFSISHLVARGISFVLAASWNWYCNRRFTFLQGDRPDRMIQWSHFIFMSSISFVLNWGSYYTLTTNVHFFHLE
ncbi:MAG: glycosyltransferase family 2 protein [Anaerolineales bacterium]|nr:glycosyltransferase family 2 protein [Anaerolineales bacterium]